MIQHIVEHINSIYLLTSVLINNVDLATLLMMRNISVNIAYFDHEFFPCNVKGIQFTDKVPEPPHSKHNVACCFRFFLCIVFPFLWHAVNGRITATRFFNSNHQITTKNWVVFSESRRETSLLLHPTFPVSVQRREIQLASLHCKFAHDTWWWRCIEIQSPKHVIRLPASVVASVRR